MKIIAVLTFSFIIVQASARELVFHGSTPAHADIRKFLHISLTDSIDFIRWKLVFNDHNFKLDCVYGLSKPNTSGFIQPKYVLFEGSIKKQGLLYELSHEKDVYYVLELNPNLFHLLDKNKTLLVGNGGFSYTLNKVPGLASTQFNIPAKHTTPKHSMAFEGRTPCQELAKLMGKPVTGACHKLKWYIILYTDPATGKPSNYRIGGTAYRTETMRSGKWDMVTAPDGRVTYRLDPEKNRQAVHLLTAGNDILLFTDADGKLLVGNEDFSYTLNRTNEREGPLQ